MMWLTEQERWTLLGLGAAALVGLGVVLWQQQHPPVTIRQGPTPPSFDSAQDGALSKVEGPPYAQWDRQLETARRVDLNLATAEELERLPQVGPAMAQRIVAYRSAHGPFQDIDALGQVPGIGPKLLERLREYVTVGSVDELMGR